MGYIIAGINHKTAPVVLREMVAFSVEQLPEALRNASEHLDNCEVAILSTCNRTEIYCSTHTSNISFDQIIDWLTQYHGADYQLLANHAYYHEDREAVRHIMRVACGLDSMVLGEPQILGQLKTAYANAQEAETARTGLNRLFQHSFTTAKQIRTNTAINQQPVSIAFAATQLARQIFSDLTKSTTLLIGAGETIELVARHLFQQGVTDIIVANRTLSRAQHLIDQFNGRAVLLSDLAMVLPEVDIVVSSTASPVPVLGKGAVEKALKKRRHNPMFMVDLAVPRDIEPEASELADIFLYTVDDLNGVIEDNIQQRREAAKQAEAMIETDIFEFMTRVRTLDAVRLLRRFRENTEMLRDAELEKALQSLSKGADPQLVLRQFARSLTNKLMHEPSIQMKQAAASGNQEQLDWAEDLLGLKDSEKNRTIQNA